MAEPHIKNHCYAIVPCTLYRDEISSGASGHLGLGNQALRNGEHVAAAEHVQPGLAEVADLVGHTADCHLTVQLNHFIPGSLSCSVSVFVK